jgi:hypothetical protein
MDIATRQKVVIGDSPPALQDKASTVDTQQRDSATGGGMTRLL